MLSLLSTLYEKLVEVRKYVIKLSKAKRNGELAKTKINEANDLRKTFQEHVQILSCKIKSGGVDIQNTPVISELCHKFENTYKEILTLCDLEECPGRESDNSFNSFPSDESDTEMESFNLKTACTLLPTMTGNESVTIQLIENIELYESMLKPEYHQNLINFVLKSRLTQSAKLRLASTYADVDSLIKDMKIQLLTQKSASAIQTQLQTVKQSTKTIDRFGSEIESLFVDLTIAQSDGNSATYDILRPINEKLAIKRFSDGLRDSRLSTIIAARNYSSLKDAIRGAKDEELSGPPSTSGVGYVMHRGQRRGQRGKFRSNNRNFNHFSPQQNLNRSYSNYQNSQYDHTRTQPSQHSYQRTFRQSGHPNRAAFRGRYQDNRRYNAERNINHIATEVADDTSERDIEDSDPKSVNHFFRA